MGSVFCLAPFLDVGVTFALEGRDTVRLTNIHTGSYVKIIIVQDEFTHLDFCIGSKKDDESPSS